LVVDGEEDAEKQNDQQYDCEQQAF